MTLSRLPTELIENIITHTLPEGFESIALSCKKIYTICIPFIQRHNNLRSRFHHFTYYENTSDAINTIRTAYDVIIRIAIEPIVARYIRHADFEMDSRLTRGRPREYVLDLQYGDTVPRLFAESLYLKHAGLDWQEFFAKIEEDLQARRYSQHAASFLMTLLPNVEVLKLPKIWEPLDATDKLIDTIVRKAHHSQFPGEMPSLAQVIRLETSVSRVPQDRCDLNWVNPFLALPHVQSFYGISCVAVGDDGHKNTAINSPEGGFGKTLIAAHLLACCINEAGITDFLRHTTRLRTLRYAHTTKRQRDPREWNICKFVTAIGRQVGNHLEELSVSILELRGSIAPGMASMCGFQQLRKLEFPLELAVCNITASTACRAVYTPNESLVVEQGTKNEYHGLEDNEPFISDLVPASVAQLSLLSSGTSDHAKALEVMFRHFAAQKKSRLPALEEIHLSFPGNAENEYKEQCTKLLAETAKVDVVLHLDWSVSSNTMTWNK